MERDGELMNMIMRAVRNMLPRSVDDPRFWLRFALIVIAQFSAVRAIRYGLGGEHLPSGIDMASGVITIKVWAAAWLIAAVVAVVGIPKCWPGCSLPTLAISLGYAFGFTISWISPAVPPPPAPPTPGDYVSASNYWTVLLLLLCGYFLARGALRGYRTTDHP